MKTENQIKEPETTQEDVAGLFIEGRMLLDGAVDLLFHYSQTAESLIDGGRMNIAYSILEEALNKLKKYEDIMNL